MIIDTHCHLDASEFDADRDAVAVEALTQGVKAIVVPSVSQQTFNDVIQLSRAHAHCFHALGIHPLYVGSATHRDIQLLKEAVLLAPPVAIGEIGLDYFVTKENQAEQLYYFSEQLKIAKQYQLPVILHVRGAVDDVLKHLRRAKLVGGIAHAFNGSLQQAHQLIALGFKLGFGGAMTYSRALHIRELAKKLPLEAIVLETDAPDIPPAWIGKASRNTPVQTVKIAQFLADLKQVDVSQVIDITGANSLQVLPKLAYLFTPPKVLL